MEKNLPIHLQEIIFGSSNSSISKQISKLEKKGQIKKIAPRLYTSNLEDGPDSKTLTYPEIEERLEQIVRINNETELNKVRDQAKLIIIATLRDTISKASVSGL